MLEVVAVDQGSPGLSTSVLVNIAVEDSNDNAPVFPEGNYTVYVQEDKPYGHILLRFSVTDSDDSPNGAPFTWSVAAAHYTIQPILQPPPRPGVIYKDCPRAGGNYLRYNRSISLSHQQLSRENSLGISQRQLYG